MSKKLINPTLKAKRKSFADFLAACPDLAEELADALNDMVHASTETGKASEMTLKIKLKPIGGSHMLHIEHTLDFKRPTEAGSTREDETRTTTLHVGKYGKLSLVPESQLSMLNKDGTPA